MRATLLLFFCGLMAFMGCTQPTANSQQQAADGQDTVYTEPAAMSIHRTEPERALVMIDSAVIVGNITWERGEYLKAVTQYGGFDNYALARQTCLDLLNDPRLNGFNNQERARAASSAVSEVDSITIERTYQLLTSIEYTSGNYPATIRYATEASRLAHALDMPDEVGKMEGYIAQAMAQTGRTDEGIDRLRATIGDLRALDSFQGVVSYHSAAKKLLHILLDNDRFAEMVPVCKEVLQRIDELGQHPDRFSGIKEGFDVAEYVDFARGQILVFLTTSYARQSYAAAHPTDGQQPKGGSQQLLQKAREAEAEVFRTKWSQSVDCDKMMSAAYHYMGEFERFDKAMDRIETANPDTLNANFIIGLEQRCSAAEMRGRYAEALGYLRRAFNIHDSIDRRNQHEQLNELATIYHLQEELLARQQAEAEADRSRIVNIALLVGILAAIAFAIYFFYKRRETMLKNRVLARQIAEAIKYKEESLNSVESRVERVESATTPETTAVADSTVSTLNSSLSDAALFQQLRDAILRDRLYLNPRLDRQALVDRFGLPKERVGAAFAKGSPFKSLIDFLTDCRLPYAAKLLTNRHELTIADVAHESGFSSADTFARNFKQKYALTPSQFRDQQSQMDGSD